MIQLYSGAQIILVTLSAFIVPATVVLACEGQCIVGITNALLGNYTTPMSTVFSQMVSFYFGVISPALKVFFLGQRNRFPDHWVNSLRVYTH